MKRTETKHWVAVGDISKLERGKADWTFEEKVAVSVPFEGAFEKCLSSRPPRGSQLPGFKTDGLLVVGSRVEELDGGMGRLTVRLEAELPEAEDVTTEPIGEPVFTIEWIEDQIALEQHPKCGYLSDDATAAGVTDLAENWDKLEANPGYYSAREPAGSWNQDTYVSLKQRGVNSVPVYYPKVTRTTYHFAKPSDVGEMCGLRQVPPIPAFNRIEDFEWLAGVDSATRSGRVYERRSEWIGQEHWEPLIYGEP